MPRAVRARPSPRPRRFLRPRTHAALEPEEYERLRRGHLGKRRLELVAQLIERPPRAQRALEIGYGPGRTLYELACQFPQVQFLGIEVDRRMLEYARRRYRRPNLAYTLRGESGLPRESFDVVISIDVLHHVTDLGALAQEVASSLAPGGVWLVVEPNMLHPYVWLKQTWMRRAGEEEDHFRPWRAERAFRSAGLAWTKHYAFLFPGWLRRVPPPLAAVERALERVPFLGGAIVYRLTRSFATPCASA
ncbi:MAG: hypothetical protein C4306_08630 [Thermoleophilia bacterium]